MELDSGPSPVLILALEAVVRTEQLSEVRAMIDGRLASFEEPDRWRVALVASELVANTLARGGTCTGLRVYELRPVIRIEVDDMDPAPPSADVGDPEPGLSLVAAVATAWGYQHLPATTIRNEPDASPTGKTVWCELHVEQHSE